MKPLLMVDIDGVVSLFGFAPPLAFSQRASVNPAFSGATSPGVESPDVGSTGAESSGAGSSGVGFSGVGSTGAGFSGAGFSGVESTGAGFSGAASASAGFSGAGFATPATRPAGSLHSIDGIPHFLSLTAAEHLLALAPRFELVWASGWEEKANEHLPHLLGLPALPHLSFERSVGRTHAHWKLDAIEAYAGDRALAWIDDSFNDACHAWAGARAAPTLLVKTQPASGLTGREAATLNRWANSLTPASTTTS